MTLMVKRILMNLKKKAWGGGNGRDNFQKDHEDIGIFFYYVKLHTSSSSDMPRTVISSSEST